MSAAPEETTEDALVRARRQVSEYLDNSRDEREWAELHRDYFDDQQWTAEEIATLNARGQPVITDNKIKDKVEYMEGLERKSRSDPKAFPRTPVHEEDADVATDTIRFIFDENRLPVTKSRVFQNLLIEGFGGAEVINDKDDPKRILIRYIRWDRLYRDPYSMEGDCSDAGYVGIITWMDERKAIERWKGKKSVITATTSDSRQNAGETIDDKPRWADSKRKRVQIFEHFERKGGTVMRSVFCWGGFLEEEKECVYENELGKKEWPLVLASAYIDRQGRRYGMVKRYISLQDEVNKRRSKSLHLLNSKTLIAEQGAFPMDEHGRGGIQDARAQIHLPDGVLEPTPGFNVKIESNLDLSAGHFQLLQQAEAALSATGPNQALMGTSGSISGRAKELDQQGGAIQIGVLFDALRDWQLRIARTAWNRARQFWDQEMMIRVTDSEMGLKFVPLNRALTVGEVEARKLKGAPPEDAHPQLQALAQDPNARQPALDDRGQQVVQNKIAELDVDIIIDESPDVVTLQSEEWTQLVTLADSGKVPIPPEALIEASSLRADKKKRLLDSIKGDKDPMAAQQAQMQDVMMRLEAALKEATMHKVANEADLADARADQIRSQTITHVADATTMPPVDPMQSGAEPSPGVPQ